MIESLAFLGEDRKSSCVKSRARVTTCWSMLRAMRHDVLGPYASRLLYAALYPLFGSWVSHGCSLSASWTVEIPALFSRGRALVGVLDRHRFLHQLQWLM